VGSPFLKWRKVWEEGEGMVRTRREKGSDRLGEQALSGILGLAVADALGVPVEFMEREALDKNPVVDMRSYGTYNKPAGVWSDDTSMTLCLMDSLSRGLNYDDIMSNFLTWYKDGSFTADGETFDVGITTCQALTRFENGTPALECGGCEEYDNGNGSLMRILPLLVYLRSVYGEDFLENGRIEEAFTVIHNISSLTHAHKRSQVACGIYIAIASMILDGYGLEKAVQQGISKAFTFYRRLDRGPGSFTEELSHFSRLESDSFKNIPVEEIRSDGYVVSSLEASLWCLLNTKSYRECVLRAVNLGDDTDSVAAIAGGLAGLEYGHEEIPQVWLETIARREYLEDSCRRFSDALTANWDRSVAIG